MKIYYDSKDLKYKQPFGCLRQDETCTLRIDIPKQNGAVEVAMVLETENGGFYQHYPLANRAEEGDYVQFSGSFSLSECGLYYYYFQVNTNNSSFNVYKEGTRGTCITGQDKWQLTCFHKDYDTPKDFKGKVMYQIFPDRFNRVGECDVHDKLQPFFIHENREDVPVYYPDHNGIVQNNDFFGGNLQGIIEKLPYLQKLHVEILYLNPIFMAYSNHRYDTADYKRVDPLLGTEEDFKELCEKAHACGMKVILDGVFSHTGCNSVYFDKHNVFGNGAYSNFDSPYRKWYQFHGETSQVYNSWWGIDTLPCTEEMNEGYLDFIIRDEDSVLAHWLNLGADGYRLDVADELPDEFIELLNRRVKEIKPDGLVIGEVWEDASNKISYSVRRKYFTNLELDSVMNYPYKDAIIGFVRGDLSAEALANTVMTIAENYPKPVLDCLMNILGTHDTMRILTVLGTDNFSLSRDEKAYASLNDGQMRVAMDRLMAAAFLQFTLPGCPCIYYGDEAGSQGFEDPFNRRFFPWDHINEELLAFYQELTRVKAAYEALQVGNIKVISHYPGVFIFTRTVGKKKVIAFVNLRDQYECFTTHPIVMLKHGTVSEEQVVLGKYGFMLLEADAE